MSDTLYKMIFVKYIPLIPACKLATYFQGHLFFCNGSLMQESPIM